ncbi:MAG: Cell division FtsK/SpoIIIE [Parcubacteria group bacterium GW2011_GWB1_41_6]|nr:MAG: Cell division FtsK/SpoIIIE [Parcubacteria group bacterium GW2011_GWB1_41_6]KKS34502.1 MAG: Cell division FtsK/SpoIIIE [Parcubacteria group bacterium GW2011_GWC2_42_13]
MSKRAKKAKKDKEENRKKQESKNRWHDNLKPETKNSILAVFSFALGLILTLSAFGRAGVIGRGVFKALELFFGAGFFLLPVVFFLIGFSLFFSWKKPIFLSNITGGILFLISSLGLASAIFEEKTGGYVGLGAARVLVRLFDFWVSAIILAALFIISIMVMFNVHLRFGFFLKLMELIKRRRKEKIAKSLEISGAPLIESPLAEAESGGEPVAQSEEKKVFEEEAAGPESSIREEKKGGFKFGETLIKKLPPLKFLEGDRGKSFAGDIKASANIIKRTLQTFGIDVEMGEISIGPSVTQYTLKPAEGVKLSRITALHGNLALALASHPIRIEAPIPGRSLIGIEVPNRNVSLVGLKNLLASEQYEKSNLPLLLALGRDVSNEIIFANLAKMPHLLIAGSTGTGKSVAIHSLMMSLIYRNTPDNLRFLLIDPKRVELTVYNNLPHLLTPVITDAKKAISALKWVVREMDVRYDMLSEAGVRDVGSYHNESALRLKQKKEGLGPMPFIIVVIDELADIMATYPKELESLIVRLAQMSRAVGIHIILSTQRPSVEVITGLIKANITSRIAFQVASQIDSRTILDRAGADRLLGNGDMLYLAGDSSKAKRIQGAFVSEKEVKDVAHYLAKAYGEFDFNGAFDAEVQENISSPNNVNGFSQLLLEEENEPDDDLYGEAKTLAVKSGKISASYLQRKLRVGYARAARLLDLLEERKVIGPANGSKPREVYLKPEDDV